MFLDIGAGELVVLVILAAVLLGPERVPGLARKAAKIIKFLRGVANNATEQIKAELGSDYADLGIEDLKPKNLLQQVLPDDVRAELKGALPDDMKSEMKQLLPNDIQSEMKALRAELEGMRTEVARMHLQTGAPLNTAVLAAAATPAAIAAAPAAIKVGPAVIDVATSPNDVTAVPVDAAPTPDDVTAIPVDAAPTPDDVTAVPVDAALTPDEATAVPTDASSVPIQDTPVPVEAAPAVVEAAAPEEVVEVPQQPTTPQTAVSVSGNDTEKEALRAELEDVRTEMARLQLRTGSPLHMPALTPAESAATLATLASSEDLEKSAMQAELDILRSEIARLQVQTSVASRTPEPAAPSLA